MCIKKGPKKIQIFGTDFSEKKNNQKNIFFLEKKNAFLIFFLILIFSWKTDKLDSKVDKSTKIMCLRHSNNLGKEMTKFEYILKC